MSQRRLLLTGFGPFGRVNENASSLVLPELLERLLISVPHWQVHTLSLPVSFQQAPQIIDHTVQEHGPFDACIGLGVHRGDFYRLETNASPELTSLAVDIDGASVASYQPVINKRLCSNFNLIDFVEKFRWSKTLQETHWPLIKVSDNAGGYVCEAVYHHLLSTASQMQARSVFIHIPGVQLLPLDIQSIYLSQLITDLLHTQ